MALCKTAVTPLLTHWNYCSRAPSPRYYMFRVNLYDLPRFFRVEGCFIGNTSEIILKDKGKGYLTNTAHRREQFMYTFGGSAVLQKFTDIYNMLNNQRLIKGERGWLINNRTLKNRPRWNLNHRLQKRPFFSRPIALNISIYNVLRHLSGPDIHGNFMRVDRKIYNKYIQITGIPRYYRAAMTPELTLSALESRIFSWQYFNLIFETYTNSNIACRDMGVSYLRMAVEWIFGAGVKRELVAN